MRVLVPLLATMLLTTAIPPAHAGELEVVEAVDFERYSGTWYEIARLPNRFQRGCVAATAVYSLRENGTLQIDNACRIDAFDGEESMVTGTAKIVDPETPGKLKVTFFWPFYGDYWILDLGEDYEFVVIGEPKLRYLWILAREPVLDEAIYLQLVARAAERGFETGKLLRTPQPPVTASDSDEQP